MCVILLSLHKLSFISFESFANIIQAVKRRWSVWNISPDMMVSPSKHFHLLESYCLKKNWLPASFFSSPRRVIRPVVRRQHVHESRDPERHAHRGRGRLPPLHVPAGVRPAHGRHVPRVRRYAEAGAGQRESQTDCQPRYRINRPCWLLLPSRSRGGLTVRCVFSLFISVHCFLFGPDLISDLTHTKPVFFFVVCHRSCMNWFWLAWTVSLSALMLQMSL